jgi:hypothetical protein
VFAFPNEFSNLRLDYQSMISGFFQNTPIPRAKSSVFKCEFVIGQDQALLVFEVADLIVKSLCRGQPRYYQSWRNKIQNGENHADTKISKALTAFFTPSVGLPPLTGSPSDHQQGFIAQYLWHALVDEQVHLGPRHWIKEPPFRVIDHGGDGFVMYHNANGDLAFRMWEIKKCDANFSATLQTAYEQLNKQALKYLAEWTAIEDKSFRQQERQLCSELIELWIDKSIRAGAGIGVITSTPLMPTRLYESLENQFPGIATPTQLHGLAVATQDYVQFTEAVLQTIWNGL